MIRQSLTSLVILATACLVLTGCESVPSMDSARTGPYFIPQNVRGVDRLPANVRRIALVPVAGLATVPESSLARLDEAFLAELTRSARAESILVTRDLMARLTGSRQLFSTDALPHDFFAKLSGATQADAVLFVDLTAYAPYPPLKLGIRAKLVGIASGQMLWAFDNLFDANQPSVVNAARKHYLDANPSSSRKGDLSSTVLQNPSRFGTYVASATFVTLPLR